MNNIFINLDRKKQQMAVLGLAIILCFFLILINSFLQSKKEKSSLNLTKSEKLFVDVNKSLSFKSLLFSKIIFINPIANLLRAYGSLEPVGFKLIPKNRNEVNYNMKYINK